MIDLRCKNCGAEIYWSEQHQRLECDYCHSSFKAEEYGQYEHIAKAEKKRDRKTNLVSYKCNHCGASFVTASSTISATCLHCNSVVIIEPSDGNIQVDTMVPFLLDKRAAIYKLKSFFQRTRFIPAAFKKDDIYTDIQGIYLPYYLFSCRENVDAVIDCKKFLNSRPYGKHKHVYTVQNDRVDICFHTDYQRYPIEAFQDFDDRMGESLASFNRNKTIPFHPGYLAGYQAYVPNQDITKAQEALTREIKLTTHYYLKQELQYDRMDIDPKYDINFTNLKVETALLPVWVLKVKHGKKIYTYAVNGTTGQVVGEIPNYNKIVRTFALIIGGIVFGYPLISALVQSNVKFTFGDFIISSIFFGLFWKLVSKIFPKSTFKHTFAKDYLKKDANHGPINISNMNVADMGITELIE